MRINDMTCLALCSLYAALQIVVWEFAARLPGGTALDGALFAAFLILDIAFSLFVCGAIEECLR